MRSLLACLSLVAIGMSSPAYAADAVSVDFEAALVSDYRWRGVSLSDEEPALLTDTTIAHASGAWAWIGANTAGPDYGGSELGLGIGYTAEAASIEWTAGVTRYVYLGEDDLDYTELSASAAKALGPVTLTAGVEFTPEQDSVFEDDTYAYLGWDIETPTRVRLFGHVGRDDGAFAPEPNAIDYSIGAGIPIQAFELALEHVDVEGAEGAWVLRVAYNG